MSLMLAGSRRRPAQRLPRELDIHLAGTLEHERALDTSPLSNRLFQPDQHRVKTAWFERHGRSRLDLKATSDGAHFRDAVLGHHVVDLEAPRDRRRTTHQAI